MTDKQPEVWLRGPVKDIPDLLQPAAHALLQTLEEANKYTLNVPDSKLWKKPTGRASIAFHLQHITGVIDRMLTYAQDNTLSEKQFDYLKSEGVVNASITKALLLQNLETKIQEALAYFKSIPNSNLTATRTVGRKKLPSTVIGLLFHAAEHSQRHIGQLLVTTSIILK